MARKEKIEHDPHNYTMAEYLAYCRLYQLCHGGMPKRYVLEQDRAEYERLRATLTMPLMWCELQIFDRQFMLMDTMKKILPGFPYSKYHHYDLSEIYYLLPDYMAAERAAGIEYGLEYQTEGRL